MSDDLILNIIDNIYEDQVLGHNETDDNILTQYLKMNLLIRINSLEEIKIFLYYLYNYQLRNHRESSIDLANLIYYKTNFIFTFDELKNKMLDFYTCNSLVEFYDNYLNQKCEYNINPDDLFVKFLRNEINCRNCCFYSYPCCDGCNGIIKKKPTIYILNLNYKNKLLV